MYKKNKSLFLKTHLFSILLLLSVNTIATEVADGTIENKQAVVQLLNNQNGLFTYQLKGTNPPLTVTAPSFEINSKPTKLELRDIKRMPSGRLANGVVEHSFTAILASNSKIAVKLFFRMSDDSPIVRFRYLLSADKDIYLTRSRLSDNLQYFGVKMSEHYQFKEIRLSDYNEKHHSYTLSEPVIHPASFENGSAVMGPIILCANPNTNQSYVMAYEHGSQFPDAFVQFQLNKDYTIAAKAVKGNYLDRQNLKGSPYETIWLQIGGVKGDEQQMAATYREFATKYLSENSESRKPYLYYNTWGRQERVAWAGGKYQQTMNLKQTLDEIQRTKDLGIDVFVIDVAWFLKTGDWNVNTNPAFFPDTLKQVIKALEANNMKLGLWFNPVVAARTSEMLKRNADARSTWDGKVKGFDPIWETEESTPICLVSKYWEDYTDVLLRVARDLKISYVKWDAIGQYGCNDANHFHGTKANSPGERSDRYGFLLPIYLSKVVEKVNKQYPDVIFDFDITEGGRAVGLSFLASGKYFAMNNGPYFHNFDLSETWGSPLPNKNANVFVHPGPARTWFTRSVLSYDKWLPSTLFLTHYQLDGSRNSQRINVASLILGQNGVWGEILKIAEADVKYISMELNRYKKVKDDITAANPVSLGTPGDHFEVHEKLNKNGRGAVVVFANGTGKISYVTRNRVAPDFVPSPGSTVEIDAKGRAVITVDFKEPDAAIFWFGIKE
jgi:alpha-galactosidase